MKARLVMILSMFLLGTTVAAVQLDIGTAWVHVQPVNDTPTAVRDAATTIEDTAVVIDVLANDIDPEGDPIHVTKVWKPQHGAVNLGADGKITYTPDENFSGVDWFLYSVSDRPSDLADLEVGMVVDNPMPTVGQTVTFTVTLTNNGPDAATGITVRYTPAEGFEAVTYAPTVGVYAEGLWMIDALPAGTKAMLIIQGKATGGE